MKPRNHSLRFKITLLFLLTTVIPVLLIGLVIPFYYQSMLSKEKQTLTEGTLTAMSHNIETYLDELERLTLAPFLHDNIMQTLKLKLNPLTDTLTDYSKLQADRTLQETLLIMFQNTRSDILGTVLLPFDNSVYVTDKKGPSVHIPDFPFAEQDWYKQALARNGEATFISPHQRNYLISPSEGEVFSVARLIKDPDSQKPLAVIMADADTGILSEIVQDIHFEVNSVITIFDSNQKLLYSSKPVPRDMEIQIGRHPEFVESGGDKYVLVKKTIPSSGWEIVLLMSHKEIQSKVRWLYIMACLFTFGGLTLTSMLYAYLSLSVVNPIRRMMTIMGRVRDGDMDKRVKPKGRDEIAQLGQALDEMITRLNDTIIREYRTGLAKKEAEYRALQSQIQPHFLYNTLNGLVGLNREGQTKELEKAIVSLSSMLRYSLEFRDWVTLKEEFQFLSRYGELQKLRFQERLDLSIWCDPELESFRIPKLLLQPLMENAIVHGVEPCTKSCLIRIRAESEKQQGQGSKIRLIVEDNGVGFAADKLRKQTSVGFQNVRDRLEMAYPAATMDVFSIQDVGTKITLTIHCSDTLSMS